MIGSTFPHLLRPRRPHAEPIQPYVPPTLPLYASPEALETAQELKDLTKAAGPVIPTTPFANRNDYAAIRDMSGVLAGHSPADVQRMVMGADFANALFIVSQRP